MAESTPPAMIDPAFRIHDAADAYAAAGLLTADERSGYRSEAFGAAAAGGIAVVLDAGGMVVRPRRVDSEIFGCSVASAALVWHEGDGASFDAATDRAVEAVLSTAAEQLRGECDLVTLLVDGGDVQLLEALQRRHARIAGANSLWIGRLPPTFDRAGDVPTTELRPGTAAPEERDALASAARDAYGSYRSHWSADPRLAGADCTAPYVAAVAAHADAGGRTVVLRNDAGRIVAFSTLQPHATLNAAAGNASAIETELVGVVADARGSGAFDTVMRESFVAARDAGFTHIVYGCAAANFAAQALLVRAGFLRPRRFTYRVHWWLDE